MLRWYAHALSPVRPNAQERPAPVVSRDSVPILLEGPFYLLTFPTTYSIVNNRSKIPITIPATAWPLAGPISRLGYCRSTEPIWLSVREPLYIAIGARIKPKQKTPTMLKVSALLASDLIPSS